MLYTGRINRSFSYINKNPLHNVGPDKFMNPYLILSHTSLLFSGETQSMILVTRSLTGKVIICFGRWLSGHEFSNCDTLLLSVFNTEFENNFKKGKKNIVKNLTAQSSHLRLFAQLLDIYVLGFRTTMLHLGGFSFAWLMQF